MPYQIGVDSADAFVKYLVNVVVVTMTVAWLFMLFVKSIDSKVIRHRKPFSIAMTLQLFFVTLRNLSTMMLSSVSRTLPTLLSDGCLCGYRLSALLPCCLVAWSPEKRLVTWAGLQSMGRIYSAKYPGGQCTQQMYTEHHANA
jgi:hypothetical protein